MAQPALVLLHGLASNATRWWDFAARARLPGWKILRPDLRGAAGHGDRGRVGMREWCDDLARLLDAEGAQRAVVAGHCLGASIALNFAARHPERIAGLVLIEPMPPAALAGTLGVLRRFRFLLRLLALPVRALNALGLRRRALAPMDLEQWDKAQRAGALDLERFASPFSDLRSVPVASYLEALAALGDPLPPLAAVRCPVLVLMSRNSTMTDPAKARALLEALPDADFTVLDAEHWIPTEQPEAMCRAIEGWVAAKGFSS